jgi:hypothetical protein
MIKSRIEISNIWQRKRMADQTCVVLYHCCEDNPGRYVPRMIAEIQQMLERAEERLAHLGASDEAWNSQSVGPMVMEQATEEGRFLDKDAYGEYPDYLPETEFVWNVYLHPKMGLYDIQCLEVVYEEPGQSVKRLVEVEWAGEPER